jgi:hypothetical protein
MIKPSTYQPPYQSVDKVRIHRLFKKPAGKAQKKFKAEAYLVIHEGLIFLQQRSQQEFFNSLLRHHHRDPRPGRRDQRRSSGV